MTRYRHASAEFHIDGTRLADVRDINVDRDPPPAGWGRLVFRVELPLGLAPTMNAYSAKKARRWAMGKLNRAVDQRIQFAKREWPAWAMGVDRRRLPVVVDGRPALDKRGRIRMRTEVSGGRRRAVRVTRHSSREPDEMSVDVVGGKLAIDRLVIARVLRDDSRRWLERQARWFCAPPKQGCVVVEVFELECDETQH